MKTAAEVRTFLALSAASVGVLICVYQRHFTLRANWPSFAEMFRHRCGRVMEASVCWLVVELTIQLVSGYRARYSSETIEAAATAAR